MSNAKPQQRRRKNNRNGNTNILSAPKPKPQNLSTGSIVKQTNNANRVPRRSGRLVARRLNINKEYIACRLAPFSGNSSGGMIPDGGARRIMIDHRGYSSITAGSTGLVDIIVTPMLPQMVMVRIPGGGTATQNPIVDGTVYVSNGNETFAHACKFPDLDAGTIGHTALNNMYANKYRYTTLGYKIMYTGKALNASGVITASEYSVACNGPQIAEFTQVCIRPDGNTDNIAPGSSENQFLTYNPPYYDVLDNSSVTVPTAAGIVGILKHSKNVYEFKPWNALPSTIIPVSDIVGATSTSSLATSIRGVNGTGGGYTDSGILMYDPDWTGQVIRVQLPAGETIRVEAVACIEYEVQPGSIMAKMSKLPPISDPNAINVANTVLTRSPIAAPSTQSDTWLRKANNILGIAGKALSATPNPMLAAGGTAMATLSTLFDAL